MTTPQPGYAPVNGLNMYYEIHGAGQPLVLLHGAFSAIGTSFGEMLPGLAQTRQVIALEQARAAAGDKDVCVAGGADVAQQVLKARLIDELQLHLAPILLGEGKRLFEHVGSQLIERVIESPDVTHLQFRVVKEDGHDRR